MNQQRINRMWLEYRRVEMLNKAQRICEELDIQASYATPEKKQAALVIARYHLQRIASK